jgi:hypothetical protein
MKTLLRIGQFFCVLTLLLATGSAATSSESDKLTIFTFSQPVELPSVTLPAGTYAFKILNSSADRNIVQVFDKDQRHLYATILAIADYRPQPSNKTIIKFSETTAGGPKAIKEWFYPGETYGWEFVYPKKRAVELAKASNQPVPSMPNDVASNITQPAQSSSDSSVAAMKDVPIKAEEPSGDEVEVAEVFIVTAPAAGDADFHPTPHSVNNDADEVAARELPKTASLIPLLWMVGLTLIVMGAFFWMLSKRVASRHLT